MKSIYGFDLGTMNLVSAKSLGEDNIEIKSNRNMFTEIDSDTISITELEKTDLDYVTLEDGDDHKIFVIGEDSFRFNQIFNQIPRRPMKDGLISPEEVDAQDIIGLMVKQLIEETQNGVCVYSIPAPIIGKVSSSVSYHEKVFSNILSSLGYKSKALNESSAVVFSDCKKEKNSGIGISFGCGLTNIACLYRGVNALQFSIDKGGDWIDNCSSAYTNVSVSRITSIKEKHLNLNENSFKEFKKKNRNVLQALKCYYVELIKVVIKSIDKQFKSSNGGLEIDEEIPIVISGGTSMVPGFLELFKEEFEEVKNFPYSISEIRKVKDPLSATAIGCLKYALWKGNEFDDR